MKGDILENSRGYFELTERVMERSHVCILGGWR